MGWTVNLVYNLILCVMKQTLEKCGGIDILVSNAAVNPFFGNIMDSTEDVWDKVLTRPRVMNLN